MRKVITGIALTVMLLAGCGGADENVEAKGDNAVNVLSKDDIGDNSISIIQENETGCKYMLAEYNHGGNLALVKMSSGDVCK